MGAVIERSLCIGILKTRFDILIYDLENDISEYQELFKQLNISVI